MESRCSSKLVLKVNRSREKKGQGDVVASFERCRGGNDAAVREEGEKKSECSQETAKEEEKIQ